MAAREVARESDFPHDVSGAPDAIDVAHAVGQGQMAAARDRFGRQRKQAWTRARDLGGAFGCAERIERDDRGGHEAATSARRVRPMGIELFSTLTTGRFGACAAAHARGQGCQVAAVSEAGEGAPQELPRGVAGPRVVVRAPAQGVLDVHIRKLERERPAARIDGVPDRSSTVIGRGYRHERRCGERRGGSYARAR